MRAIILYNTSWYVYLLRRNLIKALIDSGWKITVVAPEDSYTERVKKLGVDFYPLPIEGSGKNILHETRTLVALYSALRALRPHAVLSFTVKCNVYAGLCRRLLGFQQIANISGLGEGFDRRGLLNQMIRSLYSVGLRRTDRIFFQNPDDLHSCLQQRLVRARNSQLLPGSGVDLTYFRPVPMKLGPTRRFLMFGRLLPRKGFYHFIEAAVTLKQLWGQSAEFMIMGASDQNRIESRRLLSAIRAAEASGAVSYLEPRDDVLPVIRSADVVVLPSTYNEGVPRSLLEALGCAKPIITTDWKGCRETVRNGTNGYLIPPDDQISLQHAINSMIQASPESLLAMGRASRALAEERFDERLVINAYLAALREKVWS